MRLILDSTSHIVQLQIGEQIDESYEKRPIIPARVWEGWSGENVPVVALIVRLVPTVPDGDPRVVKFTRELWQADVERAPSIRIPKRLIL